MKRRMLSLLLALCMVLMLVPAALAANPGGTTEDGLRWEIADGVITISGKGAMQDYETSSSMQGTFSAAPWAEYADDFHAVVIAEGVTAVGANAFRGLAIESVQLPSTVTAVGDFAFSGGLGSSLKQFNLNDGLKTIGRNAFAGALVETLTIPGTVESIGDYAFSHCPNLKELCFAEGFKTWENGEYGCSFSGNYALETVRFPSTLTGLPEGAFGDCNSIKDVYYTGTEADWNELVKGFSETTVHWLLEFRQAAVHFVEVDPMDAFTDVAKDAWYYDYVDYCVREGLMNGTGNGQFSPESGFTRGMVVTILWRLCDKPAPEQAASFTDLEQDWYRDAVAWAQEVGVVKGMDAAHFAPEQNISRQDFVTILCRFLAAAGGRIETGDLSAYPDQNQVADYALIPMQWAVKVGVITGNAVGGKTILDPNGTTTRAQAAAIFMRFCETEFEFEVEA